jgi:beta-glucanase (GH16 family)
MHMLKRNLWLIVLHAGFFAACSKSGGSSTPPAPTVPAASSDNISVQRADTGSHIRLYVNLSTAASKDVTIGYATADGSATSGKDYTGASGSITITAGQTLGYVDLAIKGDSLRQSMQQFYITLSNPVNCTLKNASDTVFITNDGTYLPTDNTGYTSPTSYAGYKLAWSDEFDSNAVNTKNWKFESGAGGWGNNELEYYTGRPQNVFVSQGNLIIEARKENYNGSQYTSTRMNTAGMQEFTYGHIDIRAKLPVAKGLWPATWALGADIGTVPWPKCGEMDIMELVGSYPSRVTSTLHWADATGADSYKNNNYSLSSGDFSQQFHVFSADWRQDTVTFAVDGNPFITVTKADANGNNFPFNSPFFFIFNVAVGGNWPGSPDATTVFPQRMFVDYIRVFAKQ